MSNPAKYQTGRRSKPAVSADIRRVQHDTDHQLRQYFDRQAQAALAADPAYGRLWQVTADLALAGGKRIRPYMTVLSYQAYGGREYDSILPVATAFELLHVSLLIHDDIADRDILRRGVDNVTGRYLKLYGAGGLSASDVRHHADAAALLAGDLMLSAAHGLVTEGGLPAAQKMLAHRIIGDALFMAAGGQLLDMEAGLGGVTTTVAADPFKIASMKTSSYSFIAPLKCGALLAEAPPDQIDRLVALGHTLGLAFQLADDLLGVFGDELLTGKPNLTDLQEGKQTYLMQLTRRYATAAQMAEVGRYFGRSDLTPAQADTIRAIMTECGAKAEAEATLELQRQEAGRQVEGLDVSDEACRKLHAVVDMVTGTKS